MKNSTLIWDLPVRIFHWVLALGFAAAAVISLVYGEHSPLFPYHSIIGLTLVLMIVLRIIWGIVGTRYARISTFAFGPGSVLRYLGSIITGKGPRHIGHNPASAYAIFAMVALILALGVTGFLMARGNKSVKEIHEILAYSMLAVVGVHILGVLVHTVRHRENITASMIHGRKDAEPSQGIRSSRPIIAVLFLSVTAWWAFSLVRDFNAATGTTRLPILGTTLQIGESEERQQRRRDREAAREEEDEQGAAPSPDSR